MKQLNDAATWPANFICWASLTILDLNASITEKDQARRNYITALYNYWSLYYTLRSLTLFDFEGKTPLTENYDLLID